MAFKRHGKGTMMREKHSSTRGNLKQMHENQRVESQQTFIFLFVFKLYSRVNEAPLVLDIHGTVIGHYDHLCHFCVIQNATKVNLQCNKMSILQCLFSTCEQNTELASQMSCCASND